MHYRLISGTKDRSGSSCEYDAKLEVTWVRWEKEVPASLWIVVGSEKADGYEW